MLSGFSWVRFDPDGFILFLWTQLLCTEPRIYFGVGLSTAASTQTLLCQELQHPAAAPVLSVPSADPRFDAPQTHKISIKHHKPLEKEPLKLLENVELLKAPV